MAETNHRLPEQRHERQSLVRSKQRPRGSYYAQLRKLRETMLTAVVPLSLPPQESALPGEIRVTFPADASAELLTAVLTALKSC